jgi:uncharacterized membrane protein HdeD (DUF308 family)
MFIQLSRHWWWLALRGLAAILFGLIALAWRGTSVGSFMLLFGDLAMLDGILAGLVAFTNSSGKRRWWILLQGLISVAIAGFTFARPKVAASILLHIVAALALSTGLLEWVEARRLDHEVSNERLLRRSAITTILCAVLVILLPRTGILSIAQLFAAVAILFGLLMWVLSLNLRSMGRYAHSLSHP